MKEIEYYVADNESANVQFKREEEFRIDLLQECGFNKNDPRANKLYELIREDNWSLDDVIYNYKRYAEVLKAGVNVQ